MLKWQNETAEQALRRRHWACEDRDYKKELTVTDISEIVFSHLKDVEHKQKLMRYYLGDHDIRNKRQRNTSAPNNKLVANYCEYITNMSTGFSWAGQFLIHLLPMMTLV